ncbi:MAG: DUF4145 domain-containing protein [Thaumarchaeota archaeon S15]|nr:MAG: DUF4145 domain-containing protein [Thaumarchaeota archaeon S15]
MGSESILCPHCAVGTAVEFDMLGAQYMYIKRDGGKERYSISHGYCQNPACGRLVIRLNKETDSGAYTARYVVPLHGRRAKFDGIPPGLADDYEQACAVLDTSPAASAALARRCLQRVIREHFGIKEPRLYDEIKKASELAALPRYLADGLERVREIGNLAAHPAHDTRIGVIVDVEREEAEWTLEILESLFKHCYVDPSEYERRTSKLREKLDRTRADSKNSQAPAEEAVLQNRASQA